MIDSLPPILTNHRRTDVRTSERTARLIQIGAPLLASMVALYIVRLMWRSEDIAPFIAWVLFFVAIGAAIYQPRYGVYVLVGATLAGDAYLTPWYPFFKGFSSPESIFFVNRALIFRPQELYLMITLGSWFARVIAGRQLLSIRVGKLFWPAITFTVLVVISLFYGLSRGGDTTIALWEMRSITYVPIVILLVTNLIRTRSQLNTLIWWMLAGLLVDAAFGFYFTATTLQFAFGSVNEIAEHPLSVQFNAIFTLMIGVWLFRGSRNKRILLPLLVPLLIVPYLANNRRSAYITLVVALAVLALIMFWRNRRLFFAIVPAAALLGAVYLGVFWNSSGGIAAPAAAIRSAIAPAEGSRDDSSNAYRYYENINTMFTIKTSPITGIGFGNKFIIIVNMADISSFEWWEYITHNSIMWIWMKAGLFGFLALLYLIGRSMALGSWLLLRTPPGELSAITLMALTYLVMHFVFAYVDISWDAQSMMMVAAMMGVLNIMARLIAEAPPVPAARWPWQKAAQI